MPRFALNIVPAQPKPELVQKRVWEKKERICIIRPGGLGDVLLCTPIIKALKETFDLPITFVTSPPFVSLLEGNEYLDSIVTDIPTNNKNTMVFDLRHQLEDYSLVRNCQHRIDSLAEFCGVTVNDFTISLPLFVNELSFALKFFKDFKTRGKHRVVGLALRSAFRLRSWIETYSRTLVDLLPGFEFLIFGANDWYSFSHARVKSAVSLELLQVMALISLCNLFVTTDNGLLHIAGALGVPTIALFGSLPPELRIKYYPNVHPIISKATCVPCYEWQRGSEGDRRYCIDIDTRCMREITPKIVCDKIREIE